MAIQIERRPGVMLVRIDRPERRNALDGLTIAQLGRAFTEAEDAEAIHVVVLTGTGDQAFCSGMDLKAFASDPQAFKIDGPGLEVFTTRCFPKPVIAAVNGSAMGGGFELVLACDLVVAADHASFGLPEVKRGLVSAGGGTRLAARLPPALANEIGLTGDPIDAPTAQRIGLVNEVVPRELVVPNALVLAERLAANAPLAVRVMKTLIYNELPTHDESEWASIRAKAGPVFSSEDAKEGARAFAERRTPRWKGR